jgi:hypothetical protein
MKLHTNGDISYKWPDVFGDVLINGVSVIDRNPIEVRHNKKGWGHVLVAYPEGETEENLWNEGIYIGGGVAGQPQNFTLKGQIIVIPDWVTDGAHAHISDNPTLVVN